MGAIYARNRYVVVLMVVTAALAGAKTIPTGLPPSTIARWHVHVVNELNNDVLFVHCKSKNDDLGYQRLTYRGADFQWSFEVNFWGTTLFWCNLQKSGAYVIFETFWPESKNEWLRYRCTNGARGDCIWTAKDDGIYLKNIPDNREELIHAWISS